MRKALHIGICFLLILNIFLFPRNADAATTTSVLAHPTQLTAVPGNNQVVLSWSAVAGATSYNVKRSTVNGGPYDTIVASNVTNPTYTDSSVVNGTVYYYVVTAVNAATESMISNQVKAIPYVPIAGAPAAPQDFAATVNDGSVELTWSVVPDAATYTVKRSEVSGGPYTDVGSALTSTSFTDTTVTNGKQYYYVVSASNASGEGPVTDERIAAPSTVITVAQDGSGDYSNIKEALATIPANNSVRKIIFIKEGTYEEKLSITVPYVSLIGAGKDKTKIVYGDNETTISSSNPSTTLQPLETATVSVGSNSSPANHFYAANLTIENSSAASKGRALAALVVSDQVVFENVRFVGYQDTLYAGVAYNTKVGRQYYHNCEIKGRTDFIYGPATAAVFDSCDIISINSPDSSDTGGYITAAATKNADGSVPGLVFMNSRLLKDSTTKGKHYLGRTWQDQPTVRYINTQMDDHIHADGWTVMDESITTYYLSEYNSTGSGASPSTRKLGTQMTAAQASDLTIPRMFDGWDPSQRVIFPKIFDTVTPIVAPALPDGQSGSYTQPVVVYMEVNSTIPETDRVQYRLNGGSWTTYTAEFVASQEVGTNTVEYRYVDSLGTASASKTLTFKYDPSETPKVPAFPGAEGAAMYTEGGRHGEVYVVDNLNDYDTTIGEEPIKGSFRDAVSTGNRTVIFSVSGTIHLKRELDITVSNLTIAGQTAPGDGIAISGYMVKIGNNDAGKDIIVRYIRFRNGINELSDSVDITGNNVIIDHCSLSWSTDEAFSAKNRKNITLQWSIISDSLNHSIHTKGPHAYGGIWGGTNATYSHNLIINHTSRNPRFDRATDPDNYPTKIDFRNNVIYNWGFNSTYGGEQAAGINIINNYYKPGPNTFDSVKNRIVNPTDTGSGGGAFYIDGNYMEGDAEVTADNWALDSDGNWKAIIPDSTFTRKYKPMVIPDATDPIGGTVTTDTAIAAYEKVLQSAGASLPKRDSLDARLVNDVKNGTGRVVNTIASDGGLPELNSLPAPVDTDGDGIPDDWELANGLDPNDKADGALVSSNGYTNLENYINSLVVTPPQNPNVSITGPAMHQAFTTGDSIKITADASAADSTGSIAKVIFYDSDQKIGEATDAPYEFTWTNASEGQHYLYAKAVDDNGVMTLSSVVVIYVNGPENVAPWTSQDIGSVQIPGTASMNGTAFTVKGSGEIGGQSDSHHYVYQTVQGNFEMVANVDFASEIDEDAKVGFMIRDSLDPASKATALVLSTDPTDDSAVDTSGRKISLLNRSTEGGSYSETLKRSSSLKAPFWLKIARDQNTIYGYLSKDNVNWTLVGSATVSYSDQVYAGMIVDAPKSTSNVDYLTAGTFTDLRFTRSALFTLNNPASETVDIPEYTISGRVADRAQILVTNNGVSVVEAVYTEAGAEFSKKITLNEGINTIVVSAKNSELFGDVVNSKTLIVTYNKLAPVFTPTTEIPSAVNTASFTLSGSVNRDATVTVTLNGTTVLDKASKKANESFSVPLALQEGVNQIVISSLDNYGNAGSKTYQITYNKDWGTAYFTIQSMTLTDLNGNAVSSLISSTDLVVDITVHNNSAVTQTGTLVIALFDQEDKMVRYSLLTDSFAGRANKHMKALFRSPDTVMGYKIKAFVWNNSANQTMISNTVSNP